MSIGQWLSFRGRIGRKTFWLGYAVPLLLLSIVAQVLDIALGFVPIGDAVPAEQGTAGPIGAVVGLLSIWPAFAGAIKRLHDRDRSGWWIGLYYLLAAMFALLTIMGAFAASATGGFGVIALAVVLGVLVLGMALWLLVEIGFLRGTPGPNRYGPDPLGGAGMAQWQPPGGPQGWQQGPAQWQPPQQQWHQQQWQQQPQQWQPPQQGPGQAPPPGYGQPPQGPGQPPSPGPWTGPGPGGSVPPVRRE